MPRASDDLNARLLARTAELARNEEPASPQAARRSRPALRSAVLVAGTAAAASALLGGSAYLMGGDSSPTAAGATAAVFLQRGPAAPGAVAAAGAGTTAPTGWSLTGEPDFTPAGALTGAQLATLRSEGWTCPELRELGYYLVWARAGVLAGGDVLELRLTDGRNFATVLEQHSVPGQSGSPAGGSQTPLPVPVNILTGRPAASDGFTAAAVPAGNTAPLPSGSTATGGAAVAGGGTLWVHHAAPFAAIYQAGGVTFTYVSDLPAEQADDGVAALVRAAVSGPAGDGTGAGHDFTARLERGLGRIVELLAP